MKLIIATPCPFARKARVALREKNIDFEEIIDVPWNKNTLTKGINPLGKVPILLHKNNKPLFDSRVIVQYLDKFKPHPLMYPENHEDNISAKLVETVADGVCDAIVLIFLENARKKSLMSKHWIERQENKIFEGVNYLSEVLQDNGYFVGDKFNISDVSSFACLDYVDLRFPKLKWRNQYKNLKKFWDVNKDRKSFKETKPIVQTIDPIEY